MSQLRELIPRAVDGDEAVAIHQARVTTRRLKAAIDLLEPVLPDDERKRFSKGLRQLRRALGPLRDLDVILSQLQKLSGRNLPVSAVAWLSERLQDQRRRVRLKLERKKRRQQLLSAVRDWEDIRSGLVQVEAEANPLLEQAATRQLRSFAFCADQLTQARAGNSAQSMECGDVHELRIAGKLLRYTLELTEHTGHHVPVEAIRSFKKLQDALGKWHDFLVLNEQALRAALDEQIALHNPPLYGEVLKLAGLAWNRSERYLTRFTEQWSRDGRQIMQQVMSAFEPSLDQPAGEPPTPAIENVPPSSTEGDIQT